MKAKSKGEQPKKLFKLGDRVELINAAELDGTGGVINYIDGPNKVYTGLYCYYFGSHGSVAFNSDGTPRLRLVLKTPASGLFFIEPTNEGQDMNYYEGFEGTLQAAKVRANELAMGLAKLLNSEASIGVVIKLEQHLDPIYNVVVIRDRKKLILEEVKP